MKFLNIKLALIILFGSLVAMAQSPDITELEYYFDTDPGFGNGTSVTVSPDSVTSTTFNLDISGLSAGIHYAFIRAKDENDVWSFVNKMIVNKVETLPVFIADDITNLEYFIDTDPGFGNGTQLSVVDGIITSTSFDINVSGLIPGFHKVYFRARNENDVWSLVYVQNVVKVIEDPLAPSTDVVAMEYFFDTDPGFGDGTPVAVTAGTITNTAFNIDLSGLSTGFHKVYFRTKNENDVWSLNYIQNIVTVSEDAIPPSTDIVAMEYFFDIDPGFGNGTSVPVIADTFTSTAFNIDVSGLVAGHHKVYFRTKNENEIWSLAYLQNLVKVTAEALPESPNIIAMEYFIDTDPGFGNGTDIPITADSIIDETFGIDVSGLSPHDHNLYVRVMDENNNWSFIVVDTFNIAEVELTAYLEGPYNGSDMNTDLNSGGNLPLNQPFNIPPWNYAGTESVGSIPNANVVDWVLMEVRNAADAPSATPGTIIFRQAAFILTDGSIVDLDGFSNLEFKVHIENNNYVVLYHRNHLGIMSAAELSYIGWKYSLDFTTGSGQAYNSGQTDLGGGVYGIIGGNANSDGAINVLDLSLKWDFEAGESGYFNGDMNMDTEVDNEDKNYIWLNNLGSSSTIPE